KRPVLGILPNNASKLLLEYVKSELVANVDDVVQIQDVLMRIISAWKSNTLETLVPDWHRCRTFTASSQANDLSLALSGRPPKRSYSLGDVDIPESLKY